MSADRQTAGVAGALLSGLNEEQRQAVCATEPTILVVAGPGTGKTRVITHRIAYAVQARGVEAGRIVAVTFTNRAADEMRQRVQDMLGGECDARIGTFHWLGQTILRRHAHRLSLPRDFRLLTPRESAAALRSVAGGLWQESPPLQRMTAAISALKNGLDLPAAAQRFGILPDALSALAAAYEARLRSLRALDLDDLLAQSVVLLRDHEDLRTRFQESLCELLVDEFQDSNPVQQELLALLHPRAGSLLAVGDEDQAIYGWRQAGSGTTAQFRRLFPDARMIVLRSTYRCSRHVLRAASSLIANNAERAEKHLISTQRAGQKPVVYAAADERDEADWIASQIAARAEAGEFTHADIAVLFRTNLQSRAIEEALVAQDIPYVVRSGPRFYELPEIRLLAAVLRLVLDSGDDEAAAVLLAQLAGIGERRLEAMRAEADQRSISLRELMHGSNLPLPSSLRDRVAGLGAALQDVETTRRAPVTETVERAIPLVRRLLPERAGLQGGEDDPLEEIRALVRGTPPRGLDLSRLLDRITLSSPSGPGAGVSLLSLHAAKGLEFPVVFLAGVEEGLLPHRRSLESGDSVAEERRLCYVGMTRARELLFVTYAHFRLLGGHASLGSASRFVGEMGPANVVLRSSPALRRRPRLLRVLPGERVAHPRWRAGTVVRVEGAGRDTMVTVDFGVWGTRRLQLCHAPLERIPGEEEHAATG